MAIVFALIAFFAWGVTDVYAAISARKIGNLHTYIILQLVGILFSIILFPFFGKSFEPYYFLIAFILAIIDNLGFLFFYKAFQTGNVSLNGTIAVSYGLVIAAIGFIFFGEAVKTLSLLGIIFISIGIILSLIKLDELIKRNLRGVFTDRGILFAILCMICWGIYLAFLKIPVEKIGWYWSMVPVSIILPVLLVFGKIRTGLLNVLQNKVSIKPGILHAVLVFGGYIAYNLGIGRGNLSVIGPIAGASPVLFVVLSRFVFKDRLSKQQWVGIVATLVGIVVLGFS